MGNQARPIRPARPHRPIKLRRPAQQEPTNWLATLGDFCWFAVATFCALYVLRIWMSQ